MQVKAGVSIPEFIIPHLVEQILITLNTYTSVFDKLNEYYLEENFRLLNKIQSEYLLQETESEDEK